MTAQQRQRVEDWFDRLAGKSVADAESTLASDCADPEVRAEVLRLIRSAHATRDVASDLRDQFEHLAESLTELPADAKVGSYAVIEAIGSGGMGTVYKARQEFTNQIVALKLVKAGLLGPQMIRRFLFEVEILGKLNHPGIARVYEAGLADTPRGRQPFFAMELIDGRPLDDFVRTRTLARDGLIDLLRRVAEAVAHAHSRGVIHRDLKPANILVGEDGAPKVLDFGVARAVSGSQNVTMSNESGGLIGTPSYMAPEQLSGNADDVDADTDVYALGVIAYELLCGRRPHDLSGKTLVEMTRIVCEYEPIRPAAIDRSLRGDLETIVLKALEKEKARRYPTASELAEDLRRLLANEPITARPATRRYRFAKFVRRHAGAVAAATLIGFTLVGGLAATGWGLYRAETERRIAVVERDNAEAVLNFLTHDILAAAEPRATRGKQVSVVDAVDRASERIEKEFANRPRVEARVRQAVASTYFALSKPREALPHAIRALELARRPDVGDAQFVADCTYTLGQVHYGLGELDEAVTLLREVAESSKVRLGPDHPETIAAEVELSVYLNDLRPLDAVPLTQQLLEKSKRLPDLSEETHAHISLNYALALAKTKPSKAVIELLRTNLDRATRVFGEDHPTTLSIMNVLGGLMAYQGNVAEAEAMMRREFAIKQRVLGPDHVDTLDCVLNLSSVLFFRQKVEEAEKLMEDGLARAQASLPPDHPIIGSLAGNLSGLYTQTGRAAKAEPIKRQVLKDAERRFGELNESTLTAMNGLLRCLFQLPGNEAEAEVLALRMYDLRSKMSGDDADITHRDAVSVGKVLIANGKPAAAVEFLAPLVKADLRNPDRARELVEVQAQVLADAYTKIGNTAAAEKTLADANVEPVTKPSMKPTTVPATAPATSPAAAQSTAATTAPAR